jgi:hypothetical protein
MRFILIGLLASLLTSCAAVSDNLDARRDCKQKHQRGSASYERCVDQGYAAKRSASRAEDAKKQAFDREIDAAWKQFNQEVTIDRALAPLKTACKSMGFNEGSDPFANCVLQLQNQQAADAQQQRAANAARIRQQGQDISDTFSDYARARQQIQRPTITIQPTINCRTTTLGNVANTSCN